MARQDVSWQSQLLGDREKRMCCTQHFRPTLHTSHFTLHTLDFTLYTPHSLLHQRAHCTLHSTLHNPRPTSHYTYAFATQHSNFFTPHILHSTLFRLPQSTVHWYGSRGKLYKTVQIICFTKVFYVTAFGFVGCILFKSLFSVV